MEPGIAQGGTIEEDKAVAEIAHLMRRAANWPGDCAGSSAVSGRPAARWATSPPMRRRGGRYSIIRTNIPAPDRRRSGSHHPQYIDVVHREHAVVETGSVRIAKAMGLRGLPSKSWQVNSG